MGHRDYYICLDCETMETLSLDDTSKWMESHWGHRALIGWTSDGELFVTILWKKDDDA